MKIRNKRCQILADQILYQTLERGMRPSDVDEYRKTLVSMITIFLIMHEAEDEKEVEGYFKHSFKSISGLLRDRHGVGK